MEGARKEVGEGGSAAGLSSGVEESEEGSQGPIMIYCPPAEQSDDADSSKAADSQQTTPSGEQTLESCDATSEEEELSTSKVMQARSYKLVLLGEAGVGKTTLFHRIKSGVFRPNLSCTTGIDCCSTALQVDDEYLKLALYDTAGLERFRTLTRNYYRGASAIVLVYSVDNPASLYYLAKWSQDATEYAPTAHKFLIGNKVDLENSVPDSTVHDFAIGQSCDLAGLVSAKTGDGVDTMLDRMGRELLRTSRRRSRADTSPNWQDESTHPIHVQDSGQHRGSCC